MEESDRGPNPQLLSAIEKRRERIEFLFEELKKHNISLVECVYLAGFLLSLIGLVVGIKFYRSLAKAILDSVVDLENSNIDIINHPIAYIENKEEDGISSRDNVDRQG